MLADASVLRSFAVLGWLDELIEALGGTLYAAHGVLPLHPDDPCELHGIRDALQREATNSGLGTGRSSKAVAAAHGIDALLGVGHPRVQVLVPDDDELKLVVELASTEPNHRQWRRELGLTARRLDAGEAASIAIAYTRGLGFASDDEQALVAFSSMTGRLPLRTLDLIKLVVEQCRLEENEARTGYRFLQRDDLHLLGGPEWS